MFKERGEVEVVKFLKKVYKVSETVFILRKIGRKIEVVIRNKRKITYP